MKVYFGEETDTRELERCIAAALEPCLERIDELEAINAELLAALGLICDRSLDEQAVLTAGRAIAKAEARTESEDNDEYRQNPDLWAWENKRSAKAEGRE